MKLHQLLSFGLMAAGALRARKSLRQRRRWEQANVWGAIMLDWDDVQAVATRVRPRDAAMRDVPALLTRYKESGATHLSLPELSLNRLLAKGRVNVTHGRSSGRIYLQAQSPALAEWLTAELQARLPGIEAQLEAGNTLSLVGDLPAVAELGLGFDPAHAALARQVGLSPVARPIGYSWVQPEMIDRTFDQAAALGASLIAVQGTLIPGHEFHIQHTVEAMQRNGLTYAYFRETRHQKGDWFLAKHLASSGQVMLAHEFEPAQLLDEDWHTAAYRWGTLAAEAGVRLCAVRFFRILHAADPLESVAYVHELAKALRRVGVLPDVNAPANLAGANLAPDKQTLSSVGISAAGAAGLAAELLPLPDSVKLLGVTAGALALGGLPFAEKLGAGHHGHHHHDDHGHDHAGHHHHNGHDHHHNHDHGHHHDHDHDHDHDHHHHHGPAPASTTYAQKGLALASSVAYPAAAVAVNGSHPLLALAQSMAITAAAATTVTATTLDTDYLLGIEEYRGYNLDWLLPLGLVAASGLTGESKSLWRWLPLAGVGLAALRSALGHLPADLPASLDREHGHAHTHHLSAFQQQVGDLKMSLSPRPLRKWSMLAPLGVMSVALAGARQPALRTVALTLATAGQVATLTGFRQGQRPLRQTRGDRLSSWRTGLLLALGLWLIAPLGRKR